MVVVDPSGGRPHAARADRRAVAMSCAPPAPRPRRLLPAALVLQAGLALAASSTTVVIPVRLAVQAPACTVANAQAEVVLPAATSPAETLADYLASNGLSADPVAGAGWYTGARLDQRATLTCRRAATPIAGFTVRPAASAWLDPARRTVQYLVDAAATPAKAFGDLTVGAEQVAINGRATPLNYAGAGSRQVFSGRFRTGPLHGGQSTATVDWRPTLAGTLAHPVGLPAGGQYRGAYLLVVHY